MTVALRPCPGFVPFVHLARGYGIGYSPREELCSNSQCCIYVSFVLHIYDAVQARASGFSSHVPPHGVKWMYYLIFTPNGMQAQGFVSYSKPGSQSVFDGVGYGWPLFGIGHSSLP